MPTATCTVSHLPFESSEHKTTEAYAGIHWNEKIIQGEDIILLVDEKTTLHATSHTLKVDLEMKELRTKDTNGKEKAPGDISWSVDGDGLVVLDDSIENVHSSEDLLGIVLSKKLVDVVIKSPLTGLVKMYTGKAYITTFSLSTPRRQRHIQLLPYRQRESDPCRQPATLILCIP